MSILLDALKRSEQQRRLGEVPDIHSPTGAEPGARATRTNRLRWILLGIVGVILLWVAWQRIGPEESPAPTAADAQQASASAGDGTASSNAGTSADAAATDNDVVNPGAVARTPVEMLARSPEPPPTTSGNSATPAEQGAPRKSRVNESFTQFEAPAQADAGLSASEQAQSSAPPAQAPTAAPDTVEMEQKAAPRAAASQPKATDPISFWELPQSVRDSLPELRITVLVYADRPEDRFLLMAGRRLFEKDEFQPGVVLDEIRRDGAVFLYRNYRFLVKG